MPRTATNTAIVAVAALAAGTAAGVLGTPHQSDVWTPTILVSAATVRVSPGPALRARLAVRGVSGAVLPDYRGTPVAISTACIDRVRALIPGARGQRVRVIYSPAGVPIRTIAGGKNRVGHVDLPACWQAAVVAAETAARESFNPGVPWWK